jgi:hypothetical protein
MVAPLDLVGDLKNERRLTLEPSGVDPSNSMRIYELMYGLGPSNQSR